METKTIVVKDIKTKEGYTKANKPWTRRTLVSTENEYFSTFRAFPEPIKPGFSVTLEAVQAEGQKAGSFDITKIISVDASPRASGPSALVAKTSTKVAAGTPDSKGTSAGESSPDASPEVLRAVTKRLGIAQSIVDARFPSSRDTHDYLTMVTEVSRQLQEEERMRQEERRFRQSEEWLTIERARKK